MVLFIECPKCGSDKLQQLLIKELRPSKREGIRYIRGKVLILCKSCEYLFEAIVVLRIE